jgi:glycosyltransferase involved in cell wall biosynthesis
MPKYLKDMEKPIKTLSIIIPAFCEAHRIKKSIERMKSFSFQWSSMWPEIQLEVIYVIEKSTDNTLEIAEMMIEKSKIFKVIGNKIHRGKGYAVRTGMNFNSNDFKNL